MKISKADKKIESHGLTDTGSFSIKNSPHAFHILSSGLYSNKIKAVVRELSCNALDAHVAAKKGQVPIEVKLPNALDKQFYVKDFGTGLTHEQVMKLYTTYFESTKQESDDFIGGLGVGSKSPFAYTDSFTVESRKDGKKRIYAAYLNENNTPAISLMSESDTNEPNGLTVGFPVKPEDFNDFHKEAKTVFEAFKLTPNIKGANLGITPVNIDLKKLTDTVYVSSDNKHFPWNNSVRMGNVVYPLDIKKIAGDDDWLVWITSKQGIFIDAPIGKYSVAASREQLQYDPSTIATFSKDMQEFKEEWLKKAREFVTKRDLLPDPYDRKQANYKWLNENGLISSYHTHTDTIKKILESLKKKYNIDIPYTSHSESITTDTKSIKVTVPHTSTRAGANRVVWPLGEQDPVKQRTTHFYMEYSKPLKLVVADTKQYKDLVGYYVLNENKDEKVPPTQYIVISARKDAAQADIQKEIDSLKQKVGKLDVVYTSKMPKPAAGITGAKSGAATTKEEIRACAIEYTKQGEYYGDLSTSPMKVLSNAESFVWIPFTASSNEYNGKTLSDAEVRKLGDLLDAVKKLEAELGKTPTTIYAVNTIYRPRMDKFPDALTIDKHIERLLEENDIKSAIVSPRDMINVEYPKPHKPGHYHYNRDQRFEKLKALADATKKQPLGSKIDTALPKSAIDSKIANLCLAMHGMLGKTVGNLKHLKVVSSNDVYQFIDKNYPLLSKDAQAGIAKDDSRPTVINEINKYIEWKDQVDGIKVSFQQ